MINKDVIRIEVTASVVKPGVLQGLRTRSYGLWRGGVHPESGLLLLLTAEHMGEVSNRVVGL